MPNSIYYPPWGFRWSCPSNYKTMAICAPEDQRGKHSNCPRSMSAATKKSILGPIRWSSLITYHADISISPIAEMHRLFNEKYEHSNLSDSYSCYANVFNTRFNLVFGQPQTDTCPTCEKRKMSLVHLMT